MTTNGSWLTTATPFIGFVGVIVTLTVNAWLARRARAAELRARQAAFVSAVLAELEIVRESFAGVVADISRPQGSGALLPTQKYTFVFDEMVAQLGVLPKENVKAVVYAYMCIAAYYQNLMLVCGEPKTFGDKTFVHVGPDLLPRVAEAVQNLMLTIDKAIGALRAID